MSNYCYAIQALNIFIILVLVQSLIYCAYRYIKGTTIFDFVFYIFYFCVFSFFLMSSGHALIRSTETYFSVRTPISYYILNATWWDRVGIFFVIALLDLKSKKILPQFLLNNYFIPKNGNMANPSHGFSTAHNGKMVKKIGADSITPTSFLELPSQDNRFQVRLDNADVDMLLINQTITVTFTDNSTATSVPVGYVGSTPVHF